MRRWSGGPIGGRKSLASCNPLEKEECAWLHNFKTLAEAEKIITRWIDEYNHRRRHLSLGYMTPVEYRQFLRKLAT